ncbi:MAG TPA: helix-turn-helix domain-containing protein [Solirubrobacterales bacterium]|nr:helix-turn-helix domain-containing protein [Solirubrobacterales bacterium]
MSTETNRRQYRKRRRAELEEETRLRITEATMHLHEEVGPARTTVSAIAERAGVQRATVYRHFPDDYALIGACSSHWNSLNPPPDLERWAGIEDPDRRLRAALEELYDWYEGREQILSLLHRDRPSVPALDEHMGALDGYFVAAKETLARGRVERGARRRRVRAAIAHGLEFETWRSLARRERLSRAEAVELIAAMVAGA